MGAHAISQRVIEAEPRDFPPFEEIYRGQVGRIYALCLRLTGDHARAEEATQAAFARAWEKLGLCRSAAELPAWLRRLTINVVFSEGRAHGRRQWKEHKIGEPVEAAGANPGLELDLQRAIERLPGRAREVFVLHDVEGYRHDEIGKLMGISSGTSKSQLHRARGLLREALRR